MPARKRSQGSVRFHGSSAAPLTLGGAGASGGPSLPRMDRGRPGAPGRVPLAPPLPRGRPTDYPRHPVVRAPARRPPPPTDRRAVRTGRGAPTTDGPARSGGGPSSVCSVGAGGRTVDGAPDSDAGGAEPTNGRGPADLGRQRSGRSAGGDRGGGGSVRSLRGVGGGDLGEGRSAVRGSPKVSLGDRPRARAGRAEHGVDGWSRRDWPGSICGRSSRGRTRRRSPDACPPYRGKGIGRTWRCPRGSNRNDWRRWSSCSMGRLPWSPDYRRGPRPLGWTPLLKGRFVPDRYWIS